MNQAFIRARINSHDISKLLSFEQNLIPDKPVVYFEGESLSYRGLDETSRCIASGLISRGLKRQACVATLLPNCLEIYQLYFGTAAAQGIFMPLNKDLAASEVAFMLGHARPSIVVGCSVLKGKLDEALSLLDYQPLVIFLDESKSHGQRLEKLYGSGKDLPVVDPEDIVLISYTSGSTANPKAMAFSHRIELDGAKLYEDAWGITQDDKVLIAMSLGWTFGVNPGSFPEMRAGGSILLLEKFNPVKVLQSIQDHRVTIMKGVPTMYAMMVAHVEETGISYDLSSLRLALCAGADLPEAIAEKFYKVFGIKLTNFLGMSEIKLAASPRLENGFYAPKGSVGKPPPGVELRIVDENLNDVPAGEVGEFIVRSVGWMTGYFKEPEKTRSCNVDGWYVSGDLGRIDEDGYVYYVGRSREQIIRGGAKIAPAEVEEALMRLPNISLAAVVGVPDELYGEAIKAFVVSSDSRLSEEDVIAHCKLWLAPFKVPNLVVFKAALPIGATGKVQKKLLK